MASLAAILAMGKPVALEASAELRDTRGFISTTTIAPSSGLTANWMLLPPVSTPISRITAIAATRIRWYSRPVSVWIGATVIALRLWTPTAAPFSLPQLMTPLSGPSGLRLRSTSCQPSPAPPASTQHRRLELLPGERRLLDEDLGARREVEPLQRDLVELVDVVGDAAARPAERERRPDHAREPHEVAGRASLGVGVADGAPRDL